MQHDERRCSADVVLGDRTSNNMDATSGINGLMQSEIKVTEPRAVRY